MDPRVKRLAATLIHYSINLKKGHLIHIQCEATAFPLINSVF